MNRPPTLSLIAALDAGARSSCAKSRRGVGVFQVRRYSETGDMPGHIYSAAHNRPPHGCNGSSICRQTCGQRCIHAEAAAMLALPLHATGVDLVHVKIRDGVPHDWIDQRGAPFDGSGLDSLIDPSGPPSCMQCAVLIAADPRVDAIWLLHREGVETSLFGVIEPGWRRWLADDFLRETMSQCNIPVVGGVA